MKKLAVFLMSAFMLICLAACKDGLSPQKTESPGEAPGLEVSEGPEVTLSESLSYDAVPEDMENIIRASSKKWMENVFAGEDVEEYRCARLELYDISEDESVFCYSMRCEFLPKGEPSMELMAGNTQEAEEPGWWRFSRQVKVERDGDLWEVTDVGTGGVSCGG